MLHRAYVRNKEHPTPLVIHSCCIELDPGHQQEGNSQLMQFAVIVAIWVVVALILFVFRWVTV